MNGYNLKFTEDARDDYKYLLYVISEKYHAPLTAKKYTTALIDKLENLKSYAESLPTCTQNTIIMKYGNIARRINYKKMAIIYTVLSEDIIVEAILPQALI
jgi:hypothetical protein